MGKKRPLDLLDLLKRSTEEMAPLCQTNGLQLSIMDLPEKIPEILGDGESLLRVLTNIIGNATKYTPENGRISISVESDDYHVTIRISDTGVGIPADKLPFIFEPFYRVRGKAEQQQGSGLGLTFCKRIMEMHGGEIAASSIEGRGSTFLLKFPTHLPPRQGMDSPASTPGRNS